MRDTQALRPLLSFSPPSLHCNALSPPAPPLWRRCSDFCSHWCSSSSTIIAFSPPLSGSLPSHCFFTFQLWHRMGPAVLIRGIYLHNPHWLLRSGPSISGGSAPGGPVGPEEAAGAKIVTGCFFPVVPSPLYWHGLHHPGRDQLSPGHLPGTAAGTAMLQ